MPVRLELRSPSFWLVKQPPGSWQHATARKVGYTCWKLTILAGVRLTQRIVVVGGGVLGTMHAVAARRRGYEVVHLEREGEARGASVRNFGLVWVSGRRAGAGARAWRCAPASCGTSWARPCPGLGFRAAGSLTAGHRRRRAARAQGGGRAARRGTGAASSCSTRARVRAVNPALRGELAGGLLCRADAIVEPRLVLPALRGYLAQGTGVRVAARA